MHIWDETLPDIFPQLDWTTVTDEQWKAASSDIDEHISLSREFSAPTPSGEEMFAINHRHEVTGLNRDVDDRDKRIRELESDLRERGIRIRDLERRVEELS